MSKDCPKNMAASAKARLTDLGRRQGEEFQLVLTRYAIERLLYRLARMPVTASAGEFLAPVGGAGQNRFSLHRKRC